MIVVNDPYLYLATNVFKQAFKDIDSYYTGTGNNDDMIGGKDALQWIKGMKGTFKTMSVCAPFPLDKLHQVCLHKINKIKEEAYAKRYKTDRVE